MSKEVQIQCTGYTIVADWYKGTDPDKVLFVLPGYNSSKAKQEDFTRSMISKTGMSALVIDYSGHGVSPFELRDTRPAQHFLEVVSAFEWVQSNHPNATISVFGSSYGGFLATQLTKYRAFDKLVLRAPGILRPSAFYDLWSISIDNPERYRLAEAQYRKDVDALAAHPLLVRASNFKGKTLVVVSENDEQVPIQTTDAYINAFNAESFIAKGFTHSIRQSPVSEQQFEDYKQYIANWLMRP